MRRNFWKATAVSAAAYAGALLLGFLIDFRLTLFLLLALQFTWTLFCAIRTVQLRLRGGHCPDAEVWQREGYGFALGGCVSSLVLLAAAVIMTQVV